MVVIFITFMIFDDDIYFKVFYLIKLIGFLYKGKGTAGFLCETMFSFAQCSQFMVITSKQTFKQDQGLFTFSHY